MSKVLNPELIESTLFKTKHQGGSPAVQEFRPTDRQRKAKARLLTALQEGRVAAGSFSLLDVKQLAQLAKTPDVASIWAKEPGFLAWFTDDSEAPSRINYLRAMALDAAEAILSDPDVKSAGARVTLIKLLLDQPEMQKQKDQLTMDGLKALVIEHRHILLPLLQAQEDTKGSPSAPSPAILPAVKKGGQDE
jgi:hypothetical protein